MAIRLSDNEVKTIVKAIKNNDTIILSQFFPNKEITSASFQLNYPLPKGGLLPNANLTLLHIAAAYDSLECFLLLIENGFEFRTLSADSYFPLHYACCYSAHEVALYILENDPDEAKLLPQGIAHHFLFFAATGNDVDILNALFENGADLKQRANFLDDPIEKAVQCNHIEILKILLDHGVSSAQKGVGDETPIMKAAKNNRPSAVILLAKASPMDILYCPLDGKNLFYLMCFFGNVFKNAIIELLNMIGKVTIEPPSYMKCKGVAHWICMMADVDVAKALLATDNIIINRLDENDQLGPCQLTSKPLPEETSIEILKLLIGAGLNINYRSPKLPTEDVYQTPSLLEKFSFGLKKQYKIIKFLLENGADPYALSAKSQVPLIDKMMKLSDEKMRNLYAPYVQKDPKNE
ncbi:hypothetical protein TRFO_28411 [Tritrichomonas foetus]|uniref:Uncharacterized protein n=1 Tax=Tritrichomonas foetus TaxID=1144522 RepID=A0A1J4K352_9EUKA|nr:hypothetical protein TRFO_28411 [Tritrichomonas foetus]|eukprot:OHT04180.1 hypothetical protein TRFO_28411 [Tritrichomonas foetus]